MPRDWERQFDDYKAITEAVLAGDARRAERLTRIHIRRTRIHIDRLPDEAFGASSIE
jgi:DNA-binding GntR family transcriptional regulator